MELFTQLFCHDRGMTVAQRLPLADCFSSRYPDWILHYKPTGVTSEFPFKKSHRLSLQCPHVTAARPVTGSSFHRRLMDMENWEPVHAHSLRDSRTCCRRTESCKAQAFRQLRSRGEKTTHQQDFFLYSFWECLLRT